MVLELVTGELLFDDADPRVMSGGTVQVNHGPRIGQSPVASRPVEWPGR